MGFKDRFRDIQPFVAEEENEIIAEEKEVLPFVDILLAKLSDKVYSIPIWFDYSKDEKKELINLFVLNFLKDSSISLPHDSRESLINELTASVFGFGEIDKLLADNAVSALSINSGHQITRLPGWAKGGRVTPRTSRYTPSASNSSSAVISSQNAGERRDRDIQILLISFANSGKA